MARVHAWREFRANQHDLYSRITKGEVGDMDELVSEVADLALRVSVLENGYFSTARNRGLITGLAKTAAAIGYTAGRNQARIELGHDPDCTIEP